MTDPPPRAVAAALAAALVAAAPSSLAARGAGAGAPQDAGPPRSACEVPSGAAAPEASPPTARAVPVNAPPELDGRLTEELWGRAPVQGGFTQRTPNPGRPATELTAFRVVYTDDGLYFGIRACDSRPDRIVAELRGRDVTALEGTYDYWSEDATVAILLDTFHDHRNAYYFSVNPNGVRSDGVVKSEGARRNFDWNGVWSAGVARDSDGWTAEIHIPWSTLRFPSTREPTIGLNVQRVIRRKTEETFWAPLSLDQTLWWMSGAGHLEGIRLPEGGSRPLQVKPYVRGSWNEGAASAPSTDGAGDLQVGGDLKVGITQGLTADLTYNTDFAQAEVDEERVNLTRFPLFFPEKRDFFLENAGLFRVGVPNFSELFYSRRIGLDERGRPTPILGGGRVTGRVGDYEVGLLDIQTQDARGRPGANHMAARVRRDIGSRSSVGLLATGVLSEGASRDNGVLAADFNLSPLRYLSVDGFVAASFQPGSDPDNLGAGGVLHWATDELGVRVVFNEYQQDFEPGLGFLPRGSVRHVQPGGRVAFRPDWPLVRRVLVRGISDFVYGRSGTLLTRDAWAHTILTLESSDQLLFQANRRLERLREPFEIRSGVEIPAGEYRFTTYRSQLTLSDKRPVSGSAQVEWGEFFSGTWATLDLRGSLRLHPALQVGPRYSLNRVSLPQGTFTTNVAGVRARFTPDNRVAASTFVQYNDAADRFGVNARLDVRFRPRSHLYLVYNSTRDLVGTGWPVEDRELIAKVTYLLSP